MDINLSYSRQKAITGLVVGDKFSISHQFSQAEIDHFAEVSGDFNPVHVENRFAAAKGFDGIICHGLHVAGLLTEIGGQIAWLASDMSFKFYKPVYVGDTIACTFTIAENGR